MLTLKPTSQVSGLQILKWSENEWVDVEFPGSKTQLIIFSGEELAHCTHGFFKASVHRVNMDGGSPRISLPFQLRGDTNLIGPLERTATKLKMISISCNTPSSITSFLNSDIRILQTSEI
eukprot:TRINITY_DN7954_c0_g1_i1.p1 TRINITY_DN7954_c0_g1~~TRINITY_DN7954_c0_g1_i1.p1  ORF type:complete len:120 (-),score=9.71 TRINITY_DN7954_c0_g1_i1:113-472(-)